MTQYCVGTSVRRAVSLGYDVTLAEDGHLTADSESLTFDQIIAHHNAAGWFRCIETFGARGTVQADSVVIRRCTTAVAVALQ